MTPEASVRGFSDEVKRFQANHPDPRLLRTTELASPVVMFNKRLNDGTQIPLVELWLKLVSTLASSPSEHSCSTAFNSRPTFGFPAVDQTPELDGPLLEVLGVAAEDLQFLVPVKVVPRPASSVASTTSDFRQDLNLLGERLILVGKRLPASGRKRRPPSLMSPAKTQCSATMRNPFRSVLVKMCFARTHLSQTTWVRINSQRQHTTRTADTQTSTCADYQGPKVLHFFSPITC